MHETQTQPPPSLRRRTWLLGSAALGAMFGFAEGRDPARAANAAQPIAQPQAASPEAFTARAFEMRRRASEAGDQPYGAVVVKDERIVGEAPSRVVSNRDPTGHAEMEAIRDAARRLGTRDLGGCVMYSSSLPCPMCEAAAYWAGISGLVYGADGADGGAPRLRRC